jgi:outer membrane protein TolC
VQRFVLGRDLRGDWWTLFRSNELTELVDRALRNNHDLKSAQAALRVARANYEAQKGALFPVIGVGETSSRQKVATADLAAPTVSGDPYFSSTRRSSRSPMFRTCSAASDARSKPHRRKRSHKGLCSRRRISL